MVSWSFVYLCITLTPAVTESPNGMTLTTAKAEQKKRARESSPTSDLAIVCRLVKSKQLEFDTKIE